jgi:hypothetical protein
MTDAAKNEGSRKAKEISLGDDFGDVAVQVNGVRVEVRRDGSVVAYKKDGVDGCTNGSVRVDPVATAATNAKAAVWNWLMQPMFGRR